jgi:hypothetical protein
MTGGTGELPPEWGVVDSVIVCRVGDGRAEMELALKFCLAPSINRKNPTTSPTASCHGMLILLML